VVRWYDGSKGYGYIDAVDGEDVFVHYTEINGKEIPLLLKGDKVVFYLEHTLRGPQATDVSHLN
jgi:CspA family cold shock protein